jgi:hypothetical protein
MAIIGNIAIQSSAVRPGESVRIEVFGVDNNLLNGTDTQVRP